MFEHIKIQCFNWIYCIKLNIENTFVSELRKNRRETKKEEAHAINAWAETIRKNPSLDLKHCMHIKEIKNKIKILYI